jgi:hypothetical protein
MDHQRRSSDTFRVRRKKLPLLGLVSETLTSSYDLKTLLMIKQWKEKMKMMRQLRVIWRRKWKERRGRKIKI